MDLSFLPQDAALLDYIPGILDVNNVESLFLSYYDILPDKTVSITNFTRGEFFILVKRCITLIQSVGGVKG